MQSLQATAEAPASGQPAGRDVRRRVTWPGEWRLATRITLVVIALAIPLELIVLWTGLANLQERRDAELADAVLIGQALAAVVDGFAADLQSTTLSTAVALGSQSGSLDQATAGEHLRLIAEQYPALRAMFLTDLQGKLIATGTGGAIGFDLSTRPYIPPLQAGAPTVWSSGIAGVQTGETTVAFGRAVHAPDGSTRAFLIAAFYPQQLVERLPLTLLPEARVTVIDDRGVALYDSDASSAPTRPADSAAVRTVLAGEIVRIVGQTDLGRGDPRFGALVPVSRLGWAVGYTLPHAAVEAALAQRSTVQAGGIALVILAAAGIFVVAARRLTQPLSMLAETADAIARGEQPTVPVVESVAEVQRLALAMRLMSEAVTEREERLRDSQRSLELALQAARMVAWEWDPITDRVTASANLADVYGVETIEGAEQAFGMIHPDDLAAHQAIIQAAVVSGGGYRSEFRVIRPDNGEVEWREERGLALVDEQGELRKLHGVVMDITERRALERMQQEFISLVSHELRNPLASIKGYAQLMQRRQEYHDRAIQSIVQQSDHLDRLISDLLDSSRAEAGRLELRRRRVELLDLVTASIERAQAQTEIHTIRLDASGESLVGQWDDQRLDQVFANLLSNAVKYSPNGGEIVVRAERQGSDAHLAVQDQGLGIDPDELPRIFDRFYRVSALAPSIQGLGIGLYIARQLVEAHGGRMWAESDGPGQGTTLHLTLPLAASAALEPSDGRTVLVVEDDESLRELIADTLRDEGYRIETARDGLEALDRVSADPPALILLDWMMPRLDGAGFATELRQRHPRLDVPIVVMTAGGVAHERAASIGAHGFINKPFELTVLLDQVARHLGPERE